MTHLLVYSLSQKGDSPHLQLYCPARHPSNTTNTAVLHLITNSTLIIFTFQACLILHRHFPQPSHTTTCHILPPSPGKCDLKRTPPHLPCPLWPFSPEVISMEAASLLQKSNRSTEEWMFPHSGSNDLCIG